MFARRLRSPWRLTCSAAVWPAAALQLGSRRWLSLGDAAAGALAVASDSVPASPLATDAVGRLAFDASKAGLQAVDKAHVQRVIHEATRGSAFFKSEQRKEAQRAARNGALVEKQRAFHRLHAAERKTWLAKAAAAETALEATRDFGRRFIHIDLDMFYAAVEEKYDASLRERPFAVGSYAMLATSNYIARQYGVRSGMPGFIAKKLCPTLWIRPPQFDLYRREAAAVRAIGALYDPCYVTVGLDELTMDVTEYLRKHPGMTAEDVCAELRRRVEEATQLTCSGGIAHTAAFAKLASNVNKPNGQHTVTLRTRAEVLAHVRDMPVRDVPGIGFATEHQLLSLGIKTCKDFLTHKAELCCLFRDKTVSFFLSAGLGLVRTHVDRSNAERAASAPAHQGGPHLAATPATSSTVAPHAALTSTAPVAAPRLPQKSTGKSRTVARGLPTREAYFKQLRKLTEGAHKVLLEQGSGTRFVCFYHTDHAFEAHSHATTLPRVTDDLEVLYTAVAQLAEPLATQHRAFRLLGVNFSRLQPLSTATSPNTPRSQDKAKQAGSGHRYPKRRASAQAQAPRRSTQKKAAAPQHVRERVQAAQAAAPTRRRSSPVKQAKPSAASRSAAKRVKAGSAASSVRKLAKTRAAASVACVRHV